mmetsp:Transcript_23902/g.37418  ORF Transcript_23902/g.37418 Transcript_23902/m.37418 type:complete len:403 (+) Transcript_23902:54-1262(+)|eukprot:CAMPEP_0184319734 /NCGR_PEP_ID=MMETSP1049-20130417/110242_1 /TAXON_ID=77928 /ORGANISM="Proteomonas sulcata, Strain CCMP704" /LENGTH=402 /DNA_ID=CAMNT_0026640003 /DNA_START=36 /DNA_END=1244 /DNA_ORIENTATION=-
MGCAASAQVQKPQGGGEEGHSYRHYSEFKVAKVLGKGSFGSVRAAVHAPSNSKVAIKTLDRGSKGFCLERVAAEIQIQQAVRHPNCIRLYSHFVGEQSVHLVMERAYGGDLLEKIERVGALAEPAAANIIRQVIEAQVHLHSQGIVHRDIKPNNILLLSAFPESMNYNKVKITDFGLAAKIEDRDCYENCLDEVVGTAAFSAPELLRIAVEDSKRAKGLKYGAKIDLWSTGCTLYMMLCGEQAFAKHGGKMMPTVRSVLKGDFNFNQPEWDEVSDAAVEFINTLMCVDPIRRPTAKEALVAGKLFFAQCNGSEAKRETSCGSVQSAASTVHLSDAEPEIESSSRVSSAQSSAATLTRQEIYEKKPTLNTIQNIMWGQKAADARKKAWQAPSTSSNEQCLKGF